jgi:hypothetical protein
MLYNSYLLTKQFTVPNYLSCEKCNPNAAETQFSITSLTYSSSIYRDAQIEFSKGTMSDFAAAQLGRQKMDWKRKQDWKSFQSLPASIILVYCIGSNRC